MLFLLIIFSVSERLFNTFFRRVTFTVYQMNIVEW